MRFRLVFVLLSLCTVLTARAQTDKGTWLLSGNVSYTSQTYKFNSYNNKTSAFALQPQIGWFAGSNLAVGVAPLVAYNHASNNAPGTTTYGNSTTLVGGGLFLRYYLMVSPQFGFYPQVNASYATGIRHTPANYADAMVTPNLVYFPIPKIGINVGIANLGYAHQKDTDGSTTGSFGVNVNGNNLTLGVSYHFVK